MRSRAGHVDRRDRRGRRASALSCLASSAGLSPGRTVTIHLPGPLLAAASVVRIAHRRRHDETSHQDCGENGSRTLGHHAHLDGHPDEFMKGSSVARRVVPVNGCRPVLLGGPGGRISQHLPERPRGRPKRLLARRGGAPVIRYSSKTSRSVSSSGCSGPIPWRAAALRRQRAPWAGSRGRRVR